jgi:uncharacterized protein (DUF2132 family)
MADEQPNNAVHGVKLNEMLYHLVAQYGWEELGERIKIKCFNIDPTIKSSLSFLRRTPWAKEKVQRLYIKSLKNKSTK